MFYSQHISPIIIIITLELFSRIILKIYENMDEVIVNICEDSNVWSLIDEKMSAN